MGTLAGVSAGLGALFFGLASPVAQADEPRVVHLDDLGLTLTLPPLEGLTASRGQRWSGRMGASRVEISLQTLPEERYHCAEPEDVLDLGPSFWADPENARNAPGRRHALAGPYGCATYAVWERMPLLDARSGSVTGLRFLLGGLVPHAGYWVTLEASPPPSSEEEVALFAFLKDGIAYAGEVREHRWTDEEARERWIRETPEELHDAFVSPVRTEHYIVLGDSPAAKTLASKMEQCHEEIRAVLPFDEVPGRRLLPVLLFRSPDEYQEYHARAARVSMEEARQSQGQAFYDCYVTFAQASGSPMRGATRQILVNRLGLAGGGAWFQEGLAEYLATRRAERKAAAALVKKEKQLPLAELVARRSLAGAGEEGSELALEAALLIEFLHEDAWARPRFEELLLRVGHLAHAEPSEIEAAFRATFGVDLAALEGRWVEYCRKR